jgi:hypothetical protein
METHRHVYRPPHPATVAARVRANARPTPDPVDPWGHVVAEDGCEGCTMRPGHPAHTAR